MRKSIAVACVLFVLVGAVAYAIAERRWFFWNPAPENPSRAQREAEARKKLAFESMVDRLPKGKPIVLSSPLTTEAKVRWAALDKTFSDSQMPRATLLKEFHEKTRIFFVESPGAGSGRRLPPEEIMLADWAPDPLPSQPGEPAYFPISPGELLMRIPLTKEFHSYHEDGMRDFINPWGFGYVKDRAHVSGFISHGFRYLRAAPQESNHWRVDHVQLVGILSHEQPVVYLTDKLPSMEQVRQGKTRDLDYFEQAALPALRDGEDLYVVSKDNTIRMLGALRATKVCQQCHDAQVGDLLGAFSYVLRPAPDSKDKKK